jgi:branched-subunit amino acid ABC-type transport system permease component
MLPPGILIQGLVLGALAGINSIGIVLLWRTTRLVNLAQPSMGLVGGVLTGLLVFAGKWNFWLAAPVGLGIGALLGLTADRLILRRLREAPRAVLLVATVAFAQICGAIQSALPFAFGGQLPTYELDLGFVLTIHPTVLTGPSILALLALPLVLLASLWFLYRSRFGLAALALGQDAERAQSLGVPAAVVRSAVWAFAGLIATVSGILAIPILGYSLGGRLASTVLLFPLAPAVFAGLRSLTGAAAGALALGVAYRAALWHTQDGPESELILAGAVVLAIALQGRRLGRAETAARASSWSAAATTRPLAPAVARSSAFKTLATLSGLLLMGAVLFPPSFFDSGYDVYYATTAAFALAALGVCAAWMLAGEVALGHWGLAGLSGVLALFLPGPWPVRAAIGAVIAGIGSAVLAVASRRRSGLSFAVIGLALASAASVATTMTGDKIIDADLETVGSVTAAVAVAVALALTALRSSPFGARIVAARDDPDRAPWFGIDPLRQRAIGLGISGAIVGLAGVLYVAALQISLSAGAGTRAGAPFDSVRSLELLAMAVIGGLGSPVGTLLAVGTLQASYFLLPAWGNLLTSGLGVLLIVIFMPAGFGKIVTGVRDLIARFVVPSPPVRREPSPEANEPVSVP